jgi:hypothetical protein
MQTSAQSYPVEGILASLGYPDPTGDFLFLNP